VDKAIDGLCPLGRPVDSKTAGAAAAKPRFSPVGGRRILRRQTCFTVWYRAASGGHHAHRGRHRMAVDHAHRHCGHDHRLPPESLDRALALGVGLNAAFVVAEVAAGFAAGSLALLADAGHNAGDVVGLLLAWGAHWLARRPPSARYTWGFRRTTIYAALANAGLLLAACGGIVWEAVHRLGRPEPVAGPWVMAVAAVGVVINAATAWLFSRGRDDANVRAAFLHMAADAAVSAGVVAAGAAIWATGRTWIDPAVSIAVAAVIVAGTWGLFRESVDLALDAVPHGVETGAIVAALAAIPGVADVHDLHVWATSTAENSLTVHLVVPDPAAREAALAAATTVARDHFGIAHTTIQIEADGHGCAERACAKLSGAR
jgi:cobalt-zinc-cadmium efflux system protein